MKKLHIKAINSYSKRNKILNGLGYSSYQQYLQSPHWKRVRGRMYQSKCVYKCYCCSKLNMLQLHHKSYKSLGKENLNHLIWLCEKCHKRTHALTNYKGLGLWKAAKCLKKSHRLS